MNVVKNHLDSSLIVPLQYLNPGSSTGSRMIKMDTRQPLANQLATAADIHIDLQERYLVT